MHSSLVTFGFLPILVFLLLEPFAGKRSALWAALAAASGHFAFGALRERGVDWLGLAGLLMLAMLVSASMRARDDFYFKIHGALVNALSALVLLVGWFAFHKALLLDVVTREIGLDNLVAMEPSLKPEAVTEMLRLLSYNLPWWLLLHALLVVHAADKWGKWAWVFVRVPGFLLTLFLASVFSQSGAQ
jgi:intracellular septation protein A